MLIVNSHLKIPLSELNFTYVRSSGPGGQNVNKTSTKAELRWDLSATESLRGTVRERFIEQNRGKISNLNILILRSDRYRDQVRNTSDCLDKLRQALELAYKIPKKRRPTRPTRSSVERRIEGKKKNRERKSQKYSKTRDD